MVPLLRSLRRGNENMLATTLLDKDCKRKDRKIILAKKKIAKEFSQKKKIAKEASKKKMYNKRKGTNG
jgi:hypothetical protein